MKQRREEAFTGFTNKLLQSERFQTLFPLNEVDNNAPELRRSNTYSYKEYFARSERLYRSPLFTMRRTLNET